MPLSQNGRSSQPQKQDFRLGRNEWASESREHMTKVKMVCLEVFVFAMRRNGDG
jgi:hypothetical protein